jgi:hypothetical protein
VEEEEEAQQQLLRQPRRRGGGGRWGHCGAVRWAALVRPSRTLLRRHCTATLTRRDTQTQTLPRAAASRRRGKTRGLGPRQPPPALATGSALYVCSRPARAGNGGERGAGGRADGRTRAWRPGGSRRTASQVSAAEHTWQPDPISSGPCIRRAHCCRVRARLGLRTRRPTANTRRATVNAAVTLLSTEATVSWARPVATAGDARLGTRTGSRVIRSPAAALPAADGARRAISPLPCVLDNASLSAAGSAARRARGRPTAD